MNAFAIVTILVCLAAIGLAAGGFFSVGPGLGKLGRDGNWWFDHAEDLDVSDRPSEDERDALIPKRPLRARPF